MTPFLATGLPTLAALASIVGIVAERRSRRREIALLEQHYQGANAATVVVELIDVTVDSTAVTFSLLVVNGGPGVARDVDVELCRDVDGKPGIHYRVDSVKVAPALAVRERRPAVLVAPRDVVAAHDLEIVAGWYDDSVSEAIWRSLILFLRSEDPNHDHAVYLGPR